MLNNRKIGKIEKWKYSIMNTQFDYMYRDAANYKEHFTYIFEGEISDSQIQKFVDSCDDENFIPRAIDFPGGVLEGDPGYDKDLDHYWCEHYFEDSFMLVDAEPSILVVDGKRTVIKIDEFLELFARCQGRWEEALTSPIDISVLRAERKPFVSTPNSLNEQINVASQNTNLLNSSHKSLNRDER